MSARACCANASSLAEGAWSAVSSVDPRSLSFPTDDLPPLRPAYNSFGPCLSLYGGLLKEEEQSFGAIHVTSRNASAVKASIMSEPKLWSVGWRRKGRRCSTGRTS